VGHQVARSWQQIYPFICLNPSLSPVPQIRPLLHRKQDPTGRWLALGLTLLGPVIVNILAFHVLMAPAGLGMAIVVTALALFLVWRYRENFAGLVRPPQSARREQPILDARSQSVAAANS
jgi:hypothetical protein